MRAEAGPAVLIFAKAPIPGLAKTRLIPLLGAGRAATLQERMTLHTLDMARGAALGDIELWCAPSADHPFFAGCKDRYPVGLHTQPQGDLGARLRYACDNLSPPGRRVILIGTDCPLLDAEQLATVAGDLERFDAVVVPAQDGGYVLLGLARPCPDVFDSIDWGSEHVCRQTLDRLARSRMTCRLHPPLWDVDRPQDYTRLIASCPGFAV